MKNGFTLVEMAIVIVILGLLAGGIMAGQGLIRASELRSIPTQYEQIMSAVYTFQDQYNSLPGDLRDATDYWGAAPSANCPGTSSTPSTDATTCNGDGDGLIEVNSGTGGGNERFRFWQHLANAGLIEGTYTGVTNVSTAQDGSWAGVNVPLSKLSNTGWTAFYRGSYAGNSNNFQMDYGNMISFGLNVPSDETRGSTLTPPETWNIDTKMDDGRAGYGFIIAGQHDTCTDSGGTATDLDAEYLLNVNDKRCGISFRNLF